LILCIKLQLEPGAVTDEDFDKFHAQHRSLGVDAPIPVEIRRALAQAQKVGGLPHGVLRRAQQLFGLRPQ
jgi:hypothetical protein